MAIDIPVNPPMGSYGSGPISSPQFSPPANSLLVAVLCSDLNGTLTVTNSGIARTWAKRVEHADDKGVTIWTAPNPTAQTNITVTASTDGIFVAGGVKMYVVTGQHPSSPIGQSGTGTSTDNNATITGYTSSAAASRGFAAAIDTGGNSAPSSTDDEATIQIVDIGAWAMALAKAANSGASGSPVTFNLDAGGAAAANWRWVALEILPASLDASAGLTVIAVPTTVPTPSGSAGAGAHPGVIPVGITTPTPSVSTGAGAHPGVIPVAFTMPPPLVTTENAEIVTPDTVPVPFTVPAPSVSAGSDVQLAAPTAVGFSVFTPDVDAQFNVDVTLPHIPVGITVDGVTANVPVLPGDQLDGLPGQIEFFGTVLGRGTPYRWRLLEGWRGKDTPDSGNAPRANRHGSAPGRPLGRERTLTWTALLKAARADIEAAVLALENATPLLDTAEQWPIVVNDLGTPYLAYGRIDRVHIPLDKLIRLGHGNIVLQWILADPRRYNINATGVTVPISTTVEISNAGNASTHPVLRFPGPVTTPRLHNQTADRVLEINATVASGQELVVNTDLGTAKVGPPGSPTTDVPITPSSVSIPDWTLARGAQDVRYTAVSGGSQVEVLYRDAWN
ncbi:hypothetical protein ACFXJ8_11845 [Nonomuraea sp. NPDC059194]|uniref:hypothetical protein n=1 Tax=Nonomuraea sp. NPDC059194 TaxID=3346764 RepID=UPI0036B8FDD4